MNNLTEEEKKIFFKDLHQVQRRYNQLIDKESFKEAEEYKKNRMRQHILINKEKLLKLREKIHGSE